MLFRVVGTQYIDGEPDTIELATRGTVRCENGEYILEYDEYTDDSVYPPEPSKTTIRVNGKTVSLEHSNSDGADLFFENAKLYSTVYSTPYGDFDLSIMPTYVNTNLSENEGYVDLEYLITLQGVQTKNKLNLSYTKTCTEVAL